MSVTFTMPHYFGLLDAIDMPPWRYAQDHTELYVYLFSRHVAAPYMLIIAHTSTCHIISKMPKMSAITHASHGTCHYQTLRRAATHCHTPLIIDAPR